MDEHKRLEVVACSGLVEDQVVAAEDRAGRAEGEDRGSGLGRRLDARLGEALVDLRRGDRRTERDHRGRRALRSAPSLRSGAVTCQLVLSGDFGELPLELERPCVGLEHGRDGLRARSAASASARRARCRHSPATAPTPGICPSHFSATRMCAAIHVSRVADELERVVVDDAEVGRHHLAAGGAHLQAEVEVVAVQPAERLVEADVAHRPRRQRQHEAVDRVDLAGVRERRQLVRRSTRARAARRRRAPGSGGRTTPTSPSPPTTRCCGRRSAPTQPTTPTSGSRSARAQLGAEVRARELGVLVQRGRAPRGRRARRRCPGSGCSERKIEPAAALAITSESGSAARRIPGSAKRRVRRRGR